MEEEQSPRQGLNISILALIIGALVCIGIGAGVVRYFFPAPTTDPWPPTFTGSIIPITKVNDPTTDGATIVYDITASAINMDGAMNFPVIRSTDETPLSEKLAKVEVDGREVKVPEGVTEMALKLTFQVNDATVQVRLTPKGDGGLELIHTNTSFDKYYYAETVGE